MSGFNINDFYFIGKYISNFNNPFDRNIQTIKYIVFTDDSLILAKNIKITNPNIKKIIILLEPSSIKPELYQDVIKYQHLFDYVMSFDMYLLKKIPKEKRLFYVYGTTWVPLDKRIIYKKTKLCSYIFSGKRFGNAPGHNYRHEIFNKLNKDRHLINKIDCVGSGCGKYFDSNQEKYLFLKDHCFSICIENMSTATYFTEKLIDCLLTGTVPIYWGTPQKTLSKIFDERGIIFLEKGNEINQLNSLTLELYETMKPYIEKNFQIAKKFVNLQTNITNILSQKLV